MKNFVRISRVLCFFGAIVISASLAGQDGHGPVQLPNGKLLGDVPGRPRVTNNLPTAMALSPDGRYVVVLHSGFGAYTSGQKQSLSVLNLATDELKDFPDEWLGSKARQTYFLGVAFSQDGKHIFASIASLTDPLGKKKGSTGNESRSIASRTEGLRQSDFFRWNHAKTFRLGKSAARNFRTSRILPD